MLPWNAIIPEYLGGLPEYRYFRVELIQRAIQTSCVAGGFSSKLRLLLYRQAWHKGRPELAEALPIIELRKKLPISRLKIQAR